MEEVGRADDEDAEQDQGDDVEDGLRDQGAEQDRERPPRNRPIRQAMIIALAGSPTQAGGVADISTPIIVAEVKSRQRSVATGSAARAAWNQAPARKNIDRHIKAVATSTQAKSERTALSTTESKPITAPPGTSARSRPRRRPRRRSGGRGGGGASRIDQDRLRRGSAAGTRGTEPSAGAKP